jgi:putative ABC transport system permease protein
MAFLQDLQHCLRGLRRAPGFTIVAVAVLGLGIGASTAIFSIVNAVLIRPLSYQEPDRLVAVRYPTRFGAVVPSPIYVAWSEQSRLCRGMAAYDQGELILLRTTGEQVRLSAAWVTERFFPLLGVPQEERGRGFNEEDYRSNRAVVLLSYKVWNTRFGADERIVGQQIQLRGSAYEVIGVAARDFRFPSFETPDVFLPLSFARNVSTVRLFQGLIARLSPDATPASAELELGAIANRIVTASTPTLRSIVSKPDQPRVMPLQRAIAGDLRMALIAALGAALCLLLLACANVASLLLSRVMGRTRELAIRAALGARRGRLASWLATEAITLAVVGGAVGVSIVGLVMGRMRDFLFMRAPHASTISVDFSVLTFGTFLALSTGAIVAVIPLARIAKGDLVSSLRYSGSGMLPAVVGIPKSLRTSLLTAQIALSLILLIGEMLFAASLSQLTSVPLGFDPALVLTCRLSAKGLGKDQNGALAAVLNAVGALPGVTTAGATTALPLAGHGFSFVVAIKGTPAPRPDEPSTAVDAVSTAYFRTLRATLEAGRDFEAGDTATARPVAIVNKAFARQYSSSGDVIGRQLSLGGKPDDANVTVVGVVLDVIDGTPGEQVRPTVYRPFTQAAPQIGWHTAILVVRTEGDPLALTQPIKEVITRLAPASTVYDFDTLERRVREAVASPRDRAILFGWFALAAMALTAVGLYGFLTCWVRESTYEFGVRLTCGASRATIGRLVLRRALVPALWGIILGVFGAVITSRILEGLLFGVTTRDVRPYIASTIVIIVITLVASVVPVRRAAQTDPLVLIKL